MDCWASTRLWSEPWSVLFLCGPIGLVYVSALENSSLRERNSGLSAVHRFTRVVGDLAADQPVAAIVLEQARILLNAESAELATINARGRLRRTTAGAENELVTTNVPFDPNGLEAAVARSGTGIVLPRAPDVAVLRHMLADRKVRDAVAAPLKNNDGFLGILVVADRPPASTTFDSEDLELLESLANHAAIALQNDWLVAQLRQEAAERAHHAAHDSLTGLPNRASFVAWLDHAVSTGDHAAVLLIDLDRFKEVNDTLGHQNGDLILQEATGRITRALGETGSRAVARLGGDEFAVLLSGVSGPEQVLAVADSVKNALLAPYALENLTFEMGASIGAAVHPADGGDSTILLQRAEVAMYAAKASHGEVRFYAPEHDHYTPRRLALVGELRHAIDNGDLTLHYQPIASLRTGGVVGAEALIRWPHPHRGFLPPDEFIPIAERTDLIRPLTDLVLRSALEQAASWRRSGLELTVSVNLSVRNLLDPELVEKVESALRASGLVPGALTLEITESGIMADLDHTLGCLRQLSGMGICLAVDDFGTGHSSLSYLQQLPVDEVKIDKSFIVHMDRQASDAVIVRSTVGLAHNLGLRVLAEGVEDDSTWESLRAVGCDLAQGYALSKPLPPHDLELWLGEMGEARPAPSRPPAHLQRFG